MRAAWADGHTCLGLSVCHGLWGALSAPTPEELGFVGTASRAQFKPLATSCWLDEGV